MRSSSGHPFLGLDARTGAHSGACRDTSPYPRRGALRNPRRSSGFRLLSYVAVPNVIDLLDAETKRDKVPALTPGDTVKVHAKVVEGNRERVQIFEGIVIGCRGAGSKETFTVRRIAHGVGVERSFLLHSPRIEKIDVVRHGKVRRAKLYYLRGKVGKGARIQEKRQTVGTAPSDRPLAEAPETAET